MSDLLYSENSFTYAIPRHEAEEDNGLFPIDLERVQKCYIPIEDMMEYPDHSDREEDFNLFTEDARFLEDFKLFVNTLAFKSHKMKYVLIECKPQDIGWLADDLSPLFLLRNIGLVRFPLTSDRKTPLLSLLRGLHDERSASTSQRYE